MSSPIAFVLLLSGTGNGTLPAQPAERVRVGSPVLVPSIPTRMWTLESARAGYGSFFGDLPC